MYDLSTRAVFSTISSCICWSCWILSLSCRWNPTHALIFPSFSWNKCSALRRTCNASVSSKSRSSRSLSSLSRTRILRSARDCLRLASAESSACSSLALRVIRSSSKATSLSVPLARALIPSASQSYRRRCGRGALEGRGRDFRGSFTPSRSSFFSIARNNKSCLVTARDRWATVGSRYLARALIILVGFFSTGPPCSRCRRNSSG
mmetsp:Transcript_73895/g.173495  ORF Transcript_73895/g.173495 Transcript_73895/m.173495 type:complete len:206 (-) Transcript_73895:122-739(-)